MDRIKEHCSRFAAIAGWNLLSAATREDKEATLATCPGPLPPQQEQSKGSRGGRERGTVTRLVVREVDVSIKTRSYTVPLLLSSNFTLLLASLSSSWLSKKSPHLSSHRLTRISAYDHVDHDDLWQASHSFRYLCHQWRQQHNASSTLSDIVPSLFPHHSQCPHYPTPTADHQHHPPFRPSHCACRPHTHVYGCFSSTAGRPCQPDDLLQFRLPRLFQPVHRTIQLARASGLRGSQSNLCQIEATQRQDNQLCQSLRRDDCKHDGQPNVCRR